VNCSESGLMLYMFVNHLNFFVLMCKSLIQLVGWSARGVMIMPVGKKLMLKSDHRKYKCCL
jgi:hypothetical protein